jgi:ArsR family transcriptional regulator
MAGLSTIFKALADPTRRRILAMLRDGDLTAGEIAAGFDLSKPSISHHLRLLKQAGLVLDLRRGQFIRYSLNTTVFQDAMRQAMALMGVGDDADDGGATESRADADGKGQDDDDDTDRP